MKLLILLLLSVNISYAKTVVVGVIDSGFDFKSKWSNVNFALPKLCKYGHKDFTSSSVNDTYGHGTHITSLIGRDIEDIDYCVVSVKFWKTKDSVENPQNSIQALKYLITVGVDVINISWGGILYVREECDLIKKALDKGIIVVAAAGNEGYKLTQYKTYYPAMCDPRVNIVANLDFKKKSISNNSNFREDITYISGTDIEGLGINNTKIRITGSSQATALYTGKIIRMLSLLRNKR